MDPANLPVPRWLTDDPCPPWCSRTHPTDEDARDQAHSSPLSAIPVVRATAAPGSDKRPVGEDFVINIRRYRNDCEIWVYVGSETDTRRGFCVTSESAARLNRALSESLERITG